MIIKFIDSPQIVVSEVPRSLSADDAIQCRRFYLRLPEEHQYRHFLGVLNARTLDPFLMEHWLSNSKPSGMSVLIARNIRVVSDMFLFSDCDNFLPSEEFPGYMERIVEQPEIAAKHQVLVAHPPDEVIEQAFVISHYNSRIYGHFLLEVVPKLAIVRRYYNLGLRIPIVLGPREPKFVMEMIKTAVPDADFVVLRSDNGLLIRSCFMPSQCHMYLLNREHNTFLNEVADSCNRACSDLKFPDKVLVSRQGVAQSYRTLTNWDELERVAATFGFTQIRPESLPIAQQISLFSRARVIAGEYGSGLHNAIFSREARHVIAFNWINLVQQAIGMARGHGNIFILPEGGQPILAPLPNTAAQTVTTEYNIPLEMAMRAFELSNES